MGAAGWGSEGLTPARLRVLCFPSADVRTGEGNGGGHGLRERDRESMTRSPRASESCADGPIPFVVGI